MITKGVVYNFGRDLPNDLSDALWATFKVNQDDLADSDRSEPLASVRLMVIKVLTDRGWTSLCAGKVIARSRSNVEHRIGDHDERMQDGVDRDYKASFDALIKEINNN